MGWCGKGVWELELGEVGLGIPEMGMGAEFGNGMSAGVFHRNVSKISGCRLHRAHPFAKRPRKDGAPAKSLGFGSIESQPSQTARRMGHPPADILYRIDPDKNLLVLTPFSELSKFK